MPCPWTDPSRVIDVDVSSCHLRVRAAGRDSAGRLKEQPFPQPLIPTADAGSDPGGFACSGLMGCIREQRERWEGPSLPPQSTS